jgi:hypothetical protein
MQWFHIIPGSHLNGKNLLMCDDALTQEQLHGFIIPADYAEQLVEAAEAGQLLNDVVSLLGYGTVFGDHTSQQQAVRALSKHRWI